MPNEIHPPRIRSKESPREILAADFSSMGEIPIRGGWGYTIEDSVVIDKNDPIVQKGIPFDGVDLEYVFVEKRIYEELIIYQPEDKCYSGIAWKLLKQELRSYSSRIFDVLTFEVTAIPDSAWEKLKAEWEGPNGYGSPGFDANEHLMKRDSQTIRYVTEYYFDITSFYDSK